ncbi:MAG: hypothetical protein CUN49_06195 [Candidatus Thermofonsia Clade 1 bacterium]|uniref:Nitroreductase family deazaflavin-dependent oxidoreductase n=1 Tax=Candidatus Thermofonsia Clade 1 bacterium TaxID=2364210 RepID=A0A2M8PFG4_9CHLR|nr:MAG: hypothetical protein CUN49_06195 [Candidatus Thermofonsia Clade 1 bacterium]RMF49458.1 MAG: DUF385 domain-containing protein [Chloroflexota bacterium]
MCLMSDEIFLYLTTIGHKSGLPHQIEIWFVQHGGRYYMVAERREQAHWVQNILRRPQVQFSLGRRNAPTAVLPLAWAQARLVPADEPVAAEVHALMDAKYAWSDGLIVELQPIEQ